MSAVDVAVVIFGIFIVAFFVYQLCDFFYYEGFDVAWNMLLKEWDKSITNLNQKMDDTDFEKQMIKLDTYAELSDMYHDSANDDKIHILHSLKEKRGAMHDRIIARRNHKRTV